MTIVEALFLGTLQGLTEFIPVSSSGHLVLAEHFMHVVPSQVFDGLVNLGTFMALLVYFRKRLWEIGTRAIQTKDYRLIRNILLSAIPVGAIGFLFAGWFEQAFIQNATVVVVFLVALGLVMIFLEKLPRFAQIKAEDNLSPLRALAIGASQCLALFPGASRSGTTMITGRIMGLSYEQAAEYSFLLSIPVMAGVLLKTLVGHEGRDFIAHNFTAFIVSNLAAFGFGLLAVGFMLRYLMHGNFKIFGYYRLGIAVIVGIMLVAGL